MSPHPLSYDSQSPRLLTSLSLHFFWQTPHFLFSTFSPVVPLPSPFTLRLPPSSLPFVSIFPTSKVVIGLLLKCHLTRRFVKSHKKGLQKWNCNKGFCDGQKFRSFSRNFIFATDFIDFATTCSVAKT